jgi:hypothetical protein
MTHKDVSLARYLSRIACGKEFPENYANGIFDILKNQGEIAFWSQKCLLEYFDQILTLVLSKSSTVN